MRARSLKARTSTAGVEDMLAEKIKSEEGRAFEEHWET